MPHAALVTALLTLAAGALFVCGIMARSYWNQYQDTVRTLPTDLARNPARTKIPGLTEITFAAPGDPPLAAWYAPPAGTNAAVVLVHGVNAERSALLFETRRLSQAGFGVLALDLPGQGSSGGKTQWGLPERRAIGAAVEWLLRQSDGAAWRVGVFGMSMGAYVVAQAAAVDARIAAVVLAASPNDVVEFNWLATRRWGWLSQYPTYWALRAAGTPTGECPRDIVHRISPRPLLIVQGERDELVPEWMARQLYAAARQPKELYLVEGARHADFAAIAPTEYGARLTGFFRRALTPDSPPAQGATNAPTDP